MMSTVQLLLAIIQVSQWTIARAQYHMTYL